MRRNMINVAISPELILQAVDRIIGLIRVSWLAIFLYFFVNKFQSQIGYFIDRLKRIGLPGDISLEAQAKEQTVEAEEDKNKLNQLATDLKLSENVNSRLLELLGQTTKSKQDFELLFYIEKIYRLIFGSQLTILDRLNKSLEGIDLITIVLLYRISGWQERGYPIDQYLGFLQNFALMTFDSIKQRYFITPFGGLFLEYLQREGISLIKPN